MCVQIVCLSNAFFRNLGVATVVVCIKVHCKSFSDTDFNELRPFSRNSLFCNFDMLHFIFMLVG